MNALSIILLVLIIAALVFAVIRIVANKKRGKSCAGCSGNCFSCNKAVGK